MTIFVIRKLPKVPATFSVSRPVERLASRILPSFNSRSKLIAARRWQTMFRTLRSRRNTESLLSTGSVAFFGKNLNLVGPELKHPRIGCLRQNAFSVFWIGEHLFHIGERRARNSVKHRAQRVLQNTFQPWAPGSREISLQRHDRLRNDPLPFSLVMGLQNIHCTGIRGVAGVEKHYVVDSVLWNAAKDRLQQISMGIKQASAVPGGNIPQDQVQQQRRFTGARLAPAI